MRIDISKPRNRSLQAFICALMMMLQSGCGDRTVGIKPEDGGLLPPPNPPTAAVEAKAPIATPAGQKPWLDTQTLPITNWYAQYLNGKCIGFSEFTIATSETQGSNLLCLTKRDVLEVPATATAPNRQREIVAETFESPDGQFRRYSETSTIGASVSETIAVLQRDMLTTTKTVDGNPTSTSLQWPDGAWGPLGTIAILMQQPMQPDEIRVAQMFVPPLNKIVNVEFSNKKWELTTLPDSVVSELLLVETQFVDGENRSLTKNWVNKAGEIVKSVSPGGFTMFKTTRKKAERIGGEIQAAQLIASRIPVTATANQLLTEKLTFVIDSTNSDPFGMLSNKVNQRVKSLSALGSELTVHRATATDAIAEGVLQDPPNETYSEKFATDASQVEKFLGPFPVTSSDVSSSDVLSTASKLTEDVFRKLKKLPLSRQFSTPTEAIQRQEGDCKAHTVLLVAALREHGVPARAASGLRIVKAGDEIVAIYHMWCEAWMGDRWLPLDPFVGSLGVGVDHIKFLESSLTENDPNMAMLVVLQKMKQLTIAVKP